MGSTDDTSEKPEPLKRRPKLTEAQRKVSETRRRNLNLTLQHARTATANSIGKIPKCKNPKRRAAAEKSLRAWMDTYLLSLFTNDKTGEHWPWSRSQIESMEVAHYVLVNGGQYLKAMRRGGFKTGVCKAAAMMGLFTGLRHFAVVYAASGNKSERIFASVKRVIANSKPLREDYPEICYPIWCLRGRGIATNFQTYTYRGQELPTNTTWNSEKIVLPNIEGSAARQGIFCAFGLTGSETRGLLETTADLRDRRPDLLIFDDIETDESADSELQAPERLKLVNVALESGAPGVPIAAFYAGTVISSDSVCSRLITAPGWIASVNPAMPTMPLHCAETPPEIPHRDLWGEYAEAIQSKDPIEGRERANAFYDRYRAKAECLPILDQPRPCETCELRDRCMDAGAVVDWQHAKDPNQRSAIQFCMDKFILKPDVFFSEFQQAPRTQVESGVRMLPQQIMRRVNGYPRGIVPAMCSELTFGIDVQKHYLAFVIDAWERDFTGFTTTYGTWPDQGRRHFSKINPPKPLRVVYPGLENDAMLQAAIYDLLIHLKGLEFQVAGGQRLMSITRGLIDSRYGTKMVYAAIRRAQWGNVIMPSKGISISPGRKPIAMWDTHKPGYKTGDNWYVQPVKGTQEAPHVSVNVAPWKSRLHKALSLAVGTRGGLSLFGTDAEFHQHELYANHVGGSERPRPVVRDSWGNDIIIWDVIPGGAENEYFDASVLAMVAASMQGIKPPVEASQKPDEGPTRRIIRGSPAGRSYDAVYS